MWCSRKSFVILGRNCYRPRIALAFGTLCASGDAVYNPLFSYNNINAAIACSPGVSPKFLAKKEGQ